MAWPAGRGWRARHRRCATVLLSLHLVTTGSAALSCPVPALAAAGITAPRPSHEHGAAKGCASQG
eukprot:10965924-Lingulodinium_polyedra.AAC.1